MRILLISDIHANLEALQACMEAAPARHASQSLARECDRNVAPAIGAGVNQTARLPAAASL